MLTVQSYLFACTIKKNKTAVCRYFIELYNKQTKNTAVRTLPSLHTIVYSIKRNPELKRLREIDQERERERERENRRAFQTGVVIG